MMSNSRPYTKNTEPVEGRRLPRPYNMGQHYNSVMSGIMTQRKMADEEPSFYNTKNRPSIMGFALPEWQRPLVWTDTQCIRFIESAWMGFQLGTYAYNNYSVRNPALAGLLIDGQQRLYAVQRYLDDELSVLGFRYSELNPVERREFSMITFPSRELNINDEDTLRDLYDRLNFGGTPHTEDQRATRKN